MRRFPTFVVLSTLSLIRPAFGQSVDLDVIDNNILVLTPTRLRQPLADVPGSITVVTSDMLETYGINSVPEALRLVPGLAVTQISGGQYTINYHGSNAVTPRRLNLLIDGISAYRAARADIDWSMLPVAVADIERIEITRGPNSASYGPNSLMATINIVTKHPDESAGTSLSGSVGSRSTRSGNARHGGKIGESSHYWMTVDQRKTAGFEKVPGAGFTLSPNDPHHDRSDRNLIDFRSSSELGKDESIDFHFAALNGHQDYPLIDQYQRSYPDTEVQSREASITWQRNFAPEHALKITASMSRHTSKQPWVECLPAFAYLPELRKLWMTNPNYVLAIIANRVPSGGSAADNMLAAASLRAIRALGAKAAAPACGTTDENYDENRSDIELETTNVFSETFRTVAGIGARRDTADSETFLAGKVSNNAWRLFAHAEYRPFHSVVVNAGGYYEHDNLTGSSFSPRVALNKHLDENNTIRFVVSRANRMPGIIEQRTNWSYLTRGLNPALLGVEQAYFAQTAQGPGTLQDEKNLSRELGYTGNFPTLGLMVDVKLFHDHLTDLISERLTLMSYKPSNSNSLHHRGAELQVDFTPTPKWKMHAGYSYLDASATSLMDLTQYSRNSGMVAASHLFSDDTTLSLAMYKNQGSATGQSAYGRQDLTAMKRFRWGHTVLTPSVTISHLDQSDVRYTYDLNKTITNRIGQQMQYQASLKVSF